MVRHVPVLAAEAIELLAPWRGGCYVDATRGPRRHAEALLESAPEAWLFGFDRDRQALELARARLARFGDRVRFEVGRFAEIETLLARAGVGKVQGLLADLGVSSLQLEIAERGFAFSADGPLDMRMGAGEQTAREIVNCYPEEILVTIFRKFGEEPQARRIAHAILEERAAKPIETTGELARLIERVKRVPQR
ncbi:MAG: 16S rRNA (cytosine(1402)-N(4))-methyltransferase RsmH, partial [Thermoanaerobaculia bacterium]|nr:16S rRNA (cytosine(1402)-N(4))-methyltransferase RsmH [Thermoanaerobaculia bacterium]